ncbi:MAG TPA: phosphatidylserine decarboxylase [Bacillota bacterium]|nr:phosphatidylserine decarboxylase [Bacillota bacterium]
MNDLSETVIFNREKSLLEKELVFNQRLKEKYYGNPWGRVITNLYLKRKCFTKRYGFRQRTPKSKTQIPAFIEQYQINTEEIELPVSEYCNFNEFFTRRLKPSARPVHPEPGALISPADSRLLVTGISAEVQLRVKGREYGFAELIQERELIKNYMNGVCLVLRLIPADYHRFCYLDDGYHGPIVSIKGHYHASAPKPLITQHFPLYHRNYREYCVLHTKRFGAVIQIEVGAMTVGKIVQNKRLGGEFHKGEEKGCFEYGASTIILLFEPNTIVIDQDIQSYSQQGIETLVKYGSHIGYKNI